MERIIKIQKEILALEKYYPHKVRVVVEELSFAFACIFLSISVLFILPQMSAYAVVEPVLRGLFLISTALLIDSLLIEVYFQSLYQRLRKMGGSYPILIIKNKSLSKKDTVTSLFETMKGNRLMKKLGIADEQLHHFLFQKQPRIVYPLNNCQLDDFGRQVCTEDDEFKNFLSRMSIDVNHFIDVLKSIDKEIHRHVNARAFLKPILSSTLQTPSYSLEDLIRMDIEDLEYKYKVDFTQRAAKDMLSFFANSGFAYIDSSSRKEVLEHLIEQTLDSHKELFHGQRIILPADSRRFLIAYKAQVI